MFRKHCRTGAYQQGNGSQQFRSEHPFEKFQKHFCDAKGGFGSFAKTASRIPVNILENDEFYQVQVFAAGRKKEQFTVSISQQVLTISCTAKEADKDLKVVYEELNGEAFERAFQLDENILTEAVHASFEDGVLTVILQKDPQKIKQDIQVSVS